MRVFRLRLGLPDHEGEVSHTEFTHVPRLARDAVRHRSPHQHVPAKLQAELMHTHTRTCMLVYLCSHAHTPLPPRTPRAHPPINSPGGPNFSLDIELQAAGDEVLPQIREVEIERQRCCVCDLGLGCLAHCVVFFVSVQSCVCVRACV